MRLFSPAIFLAILLTPTIAFAAGKTPDCKVKPGAQKEDCLPAKAAKPKQATQPAAKKETAAPAQKQDKSKQKKPHQDKKSSAKAPDKDQKDSKSLKKLLVPTPKS